MLIRRKPALTVLAAGLSALILSACGPVGSLGSSGSDESTAASGENTQHARTLTPTVLHTHPWDKASFTQGLDITDDGDMIVGTGMYDESRIYRTTLNNQQSHSHNLAPELFGEGLAIHNNTVWQLTWKAGIAFKRDLATLEETGQARYNTEGWGLCSDGSRLIMSDGTDTLYFRDPETFEEIGSVHVTRDGQRLDMLNELDCAADGSVWANVWQTNDIVRIDPATGDVTDSVNLEGVLPAARQRGADVLNGIVSVPGTDPQERRFYVTGKYWDQLYEVEFS